MITNINNNANPYYFPADVAKEGSQYVRLTNYLKVRVHDNGKVVPFKWYDQGRVMNVKTYVPFIHGVVGRYTTDNDDEIIMAPDAVWRDWQGTTANSHDGGVVDYILEDQMFPQEGIFKGNFGLKDTAGNVLTSVNIVFQVLGDDLRIGETTKYYSSELDKMVNEFKIRTNQVIDEARNQYNSEIKATRDTLNILDAQIQNNREAQANLSDRLAGTEQQIAINAVVTKPTFDENNKLLNGRIDAIDGSIDKKLADILLNVQYLSLDDLTKKYPQGASGIFILPNGHTASFVDGEWTDSGQVSVVGGYKYYNVDAKNISAPFDDLDTLNSKTIVAYPANCIISNTPFKANQIMVITDGNDTSDGGEFYQRVINTKSGKIKYRVGWKNGSDLRPNYSNWIQVGTDDFQIFNKQSELQDDYYRNLDWSNGNQVVFYRKNVQPDSDPLDANTDRIVSTKGVDYPESGLVIQKEFNSNGDYLIRYSNRNESNAPNWSNWISLNGVRNVNITNKETVAPYDDLNTLPTNFLVSYNGQQEKVANSPFDDNYMIIITSGQTITKNCNVIQQAIHQVDGYTPCDIWVRYGWADNNGKISYKGWTKLESQKYLTFSTTDEAKKYLGGIYLHLDWSYGNETITYKQGVKLADSPYDDSVELKVINKGATYYQTGTVEQILIPANSQSVLYRTGYRNKVGTSPTWNSWKSLEQEVLPSLSCLETFGIIGDSFSAGLVAPETGSDFHYNATKYQWGRYIAQKYGTHCVNFSGSGYTARDIIDHKLNEIQNVKPLDVYYIALGINDSASYSKEELGTEDDLNSYQNTFYGNYGKIISTIKKYASNAKIVLFTIMADWGNRDLFDLAIKKIGKHYNLPVIDVLSDSYFSSRLYAKTRSTGHPSPLGYVMLSAHLEKLIQQCLIDNYDYFALLDIDNDTSKSTDIIDLVSPDDLINQDQEADKPTTGGK